MMKIYLLQKQTLKEAYRYFLTLLSVVVFLILMFQVSISSPDHANNIFLTSLFMALLLLFAVTGPTILFKNLYHQTNVHHMASFPFTRMEVFLSQYLLGIAFGLLLILGYTSFTILVISSQADWIFQTSHLIVLFLYYYHLSLLAYFICGNKLFYSLMVLFFSFGPLLFYLVFNWIMQSYVYGYEFSELIYFNTKILCPIIAIVMSMFGNLQINYNLVFLGLVAVMFVLCLVAFKYRQNEKTGQSIAFKILSVIIRGAISLLGSGVLMAIVASASYKELSWQTTLMSYMIVSVIVVYLVEMVYKKNTKVFYSIKYAFVLAIISFVFVQAGANHMRYYIPNDVVSAKLYTSSNYYVNQDEEGYIEDAETIEKIKELQASLAEYEPPYYGQAISISYQTEGGNHSNRRYFVTPEWARTYLPSVLKERKIYDALSSYELKMIQYLDQKKNFEIYLEGEVYQVDTPEKRYLLKNYLLLELEDYYQHIDKYIQAEFSEEYASYVEVTVFTDKNKPDLYYHGNNERLANAIKKTFKI